MKGTPEMPQCGFSRASVQILGLQGVDPQKFAAFNVLEEEDLRQGKSANITSICAEAMAHAWRLLRSGTDMLTTATRHQRIL
jgi:hypothetical protein